MPISEDLRNSYRTRLREVEQRVRDFIFEVIEHLPIDKQREVRTRLNSSLDVLISAFEDAIFFDTIVAEVSRRDSVLAVADKLIEARAEAARHRSQLYQEIEQLEREGKIKERDALISELEDALG